MRREVRYGPRFVQTMSPSPARAMLKENKTWAGAPRKGDEVEGLRGDLASARRDRDAAIEERDRARAELENERRGRRRRRDGSPGEEDESGRSRRRYDSRDDERARRSGRDGGRHERW